MYSGVNSLSDAQFDVVFNMNLWKGWEVKVFPPTGTLELRDLHLILCPWICNQWIWSFMSWINMIFAAWVQMLTNTCWLQRWNGRCQGQVTGCSLAHGLSFSFSYLFKFYFCLVRWPEANIEIISSSISNVSEISDKRNNCKFLCNVLPERNGNLK